MKNGKVGTLVNTLLGMNVPDWEHTQTVKIGERQHQKLRALAEFTGRSKTALAAELLMAAIDDAIESLPSEPMPDTHVLGTEEPVSVRKAVELRAAVFYEQVSQRHECEEYRRGHAVNEDEQQMLDDFYAGKLPPEAYAQNGATE